MTSFFGLFHVYGLLVGIGIAVGAWITERASRHFSIPPTWIDRALLPVFVGTIVGARSYHVLTDWQLYQGASFIDLVAIWRGGVGFLGALMGGIVGLLFFVKQDAKPVVPTVSKTTSFFMYADLLSFGVPLAQAIGRVGNYINGELYGVPTSLPWAVEIEGKTYHPLFLYEALGNCLLFIGMYILAKNKALGIGKGQYVGVYLFGYSLIRFWLEFLRIETARADGIFGIFSIAQWITLVTMIVAAVLFWIRRHALATKHSIRKEWDVSLD